MHPQRRQRIRPVGGRALMVAALVAMLLPAPALGGPGHSSAQQESDRQQEPAVTFRSDVGLVLHGVAVLDAAGRPVTGLREDDFVVYEDGEEKRIEWFLAPDRAPLDVALVLDASTSLAPWSAVVRRAAETFLMSLTERDCVYLLPFADEPAGGTWGRAVDPVLTRRVESIFMSGGTALYDAVIAGLEELEQASAPTVAETAATADTPATGPGDRPTDGWEDGECGVPVEGAAGPLRRRAMVVVSDGADEKSDARFDELLDHARTTGIPVFPVAVGEATTDRRLRSLLDLLAGSTGGLLVERTDPAELREAYADVVALLRASYLVGYRAEAAEEPRWREVTVRSRRPSYRLVHRLRYFR